MKKILFTIFFCFFQIAFSQISLPYIFSDNMVLQRDQKIPIWGFSSSNELITVEFNHQKKEIRADKKGEWIIYLDKEKAGGPYQLTISGKNKVVFKNILIGDVWLASGQSNMEWNLAATENYEKEISENNFPLIRQIKINKKINSLPQNNISESHWEEANKKTIGDFSAVAYFFAKKMSIEKGIPIGIINSSWGGTVIETWIPREGFEQSEYFRQMISKMPKIDIEELEKKNISEKTKAIESITNTKIEDFNKENFINNNSDSFTKAEINIPQPWEQQGYDALDGIVWIKKTIILSESDLKKDAILYLGNIDDEDISYFNGKEIGSMKQWSDNRIYKVPKELLKTGENTIAIKITDNGSGGGLWNAPEGLKLITNENNYKLEGKWKIGIEKIFSTINQNEFPSLIYNSMINPFIKTRISGIIWYQGESNIERADEYSKTFPLLINSWREKFGKNIPFYYVQLATYNSPGNSNEGCSWAELREAQTKTLELKNTGMVVTSDVGNSNDIHPKNKRPVGERLANLALKNGKISPILKKYKIAENKVCITFNTNKKIISKNNQKLNGFEIAGKDEVFYPAKAEIINNKVIVSSDKVLKPIAVRYGWKSDNSDLNLFTEDFLPISPFRTDNFKLKTSSVNFSLK